jgi:Tfp pilus assembly protein FimT
MEMIRQEERALETRSNTVLRVVALGALLLALGLASFTGWTALTWYRARQELVSVMDEIEHTRDYEVPTRRIVRLVVQGAPIETQDSWGRTPLMWLATSDDDDAVWVLLRKRARVDARDRSGSTPLHFAAESGSPPVLQALTEAGTQVDSRDASGRTPLMEAAYGGRIAQVDLLVEAGADRRLRDANGRTAFDHAQLGAADERADALPPSTDWKRLLNRLRAPIR